MAPMVGIMEPFGLTPRERGWVELILGTPVVLWVGWPILKKFWLSIAHWALNMYSLIGLGVGLAILYSLAAVFAPGIFPEEFQPRRRGDLLRSGCGDRHAGASGTCCSFARWGRRARRCAIC